jgi:hypothetical protein
MSNKNLTIRLVDEGPAPWKMRTKRIYTYKFKIAKKLLHKQNETVKQAIKEVIDEEDIKKYQYSINAVLDEENRQYTNSNFQDFEDIDIEEAIMHYNNEYSTNKKYDGFETFYIYVIKNFDNKKGGNDDENNDCLFLAIWNAYDCNYDLLPKKINRGYKLKKFLDLNREDLVDIEKLEKLEKILNCSFEVFGDASYLSKELKPKHIKLSLIRGHYKLKIDVKNILLTSGMQNKSVKKEDIYTFYYDDDDVIIYDGKEEKKLNREEFTTQKNSKEKLFVMSKKEQLKEEREKYIDKADYFLNNFGDKFNFYQSQYISKINLRNILLCLKGTAEPEEIGGIEQYIIDKAFRGGLRYYKKGTYENVFDYDYNVMYSHFLTWDKFYFPIKAPEYKTITKEEIEKWTCYEYGYYLVEPINSHKFMQVKREYSWYSHFDLYCFKELDIKFRLKKVNNNHLFYNADTRINGNLLRNYVETLFKMKNNCKEEYKEDVKTFLSSIYGCLTSKNKKVVYASNNNIIDIEDNLIQNIEHTEKGATLELLDSHKIFNNNYARISFITAYCRLKMIQTLKKHVDNFDDIIAINTDGFTTTKEVEGLKIGKEMGEFKVKKYSKFTIKHLNHNGIIKVE